MSGIRTFPTDGQGSVAAAIKGVGASVDVLRRHQVRMPQRGYSEDNATYTVNWNSATTERADTQIEVTVPQTASQVRVYAEVQIDETVAGGGLPALVLYEDGVAAGPDDGFLIVIDDSWAEDGRVVCTGTGGQFTVPGGTIYRTGNDGFAIPPWGSLRMYPTTPGTHTFGLATRILAGSAVSGSYEYSNLKMWLEVV